MNNTERALAISGLVIAGLLIERHATKKKIKETNRRVTNANSFLQIAFRMLPELVEQIPDGVQLSEKVSVDMSAFMLFNENDLM